MINICNLTFTASNRGFLEKNHRFQQKADMKRLKNDSSKTSFNKK